MESAFLRTSSTLGGFFSLPVVLLPIVIDSTFTVSVDTGTGKFADTGAALTSRGCIVGKLLASTEEMADATALVVVVDVSVTSLRSPAELA